jgi:hypothetical protein
MHKAKQRALPARLDVPHLADLFASPEVVGASKENELGDGFPPRSLHITSQG